MSQRTTKSDAQIEQGRARSGGRGVTLGLYGEDEIPARLTRYYSGKPRPDPTV